MPTPYNAIPQTTFEAPREYRWGSAPRSETVTVVSGTGALQFGANAPTLITLLDPVTAAGQVTHDYGAVVCLFGSDGSTPGISTDSELYMRNFGPYVWLPSAGKWNLQFQQLGTLLAPLTFVGIRYSVLENPEPKYVHACLTATNSITSQIRSTPQTINPATTTAVNWAAKSSFGFSDSGVLRVHGARLQNVGANPVTIAVGEAPALVTQGFTVAAGDFIDFPPGTLSMSAVYAFSTLGTTLQTLVYYR